MPIQCHDAVCKHHRWRRKKRHRYIHPTWHSPFTIYSVKMHSDYILLSDDDDIIPMSSSPPKPLARRPSLIDTLEALERPEPKRAKTDKTAEKVAEKAAKDRAKAEAKLAKEIAKSRAAKEKDVNKVRIP